MTAAPDPTEVRALTAAEHERAAQILRNARDGYRERFPEGHVFSPSDQWAYALIAVRNALASATEAPPVAGMGEVKPIDMLLYCPMCGIQHVDEPEHVLVWTGGSAPEPSHDEVTWDNPPHRSHLCHGCGCIWRPADVPTNGVVRIATAGKADTWGESNSAALTKPTPPASVDDDCDLCFGIMSRACPRCNPCAVEGTPPASVSGEVVVQAISDGLAVRIHTLLATLSADDFKNTDIGGAYAEEARELVQALAAAPEAATPSALNSLINRVEDCQRDCPAGHNNLSGRLTAIRETLVAIDPDKAPSAVGGVDRMREADLRSAVFRFVHEHLPTAFDDRSTRYRAGVQVEIERLMQEARAALTKGETSPDRGEG